MFGDPPRRATLGTTAAVVGALALHWTANAITPYGVHRDEMLYVAMGHHFALWRMDGPPAIAAIARVTTSVLGTSVFALRVIPTLAGAAIIILGSLMALTFGGGWVAQVLAALSVAASPMFIGASNVLQPVVFDQLSWTLILHAAARLASAERGQSMRWWVWLGVVAGIGVLTKFIVCVLFSSMAVAALLTRAWRHANWRGLLTALVLATVIGSPSLVGQLRLSFPIIAQMRHLQASQLTHVDPLDWARRLVYLAPTSLLAFAGAALLLRSARFRIIGLACLVAFATIFALRGKFYYAQPVFPTLWAAGAVAVERVPRPSGRWIRAAAPALIVADAVLLMPLTLPVMNPPTLVRYLAALGITERTDKGEVVRLPADYADMLGWPEQVAAVAAVYRSLPSGERSRTILLAENYGEAAAIDFYGGRYQLPPALTNQGSYYLYGPGDRPGTTAIAIGIPRSTLLGMYESVTLAGRVDDPDTVPEESHLDIYVCRGAHESIQALWPHLAGRY